MNRLAQEKSPYLLQHADNPVDWFPWGEEAFAKARAENKPIFLSVGYSTCHWCHVMAHESFDDKATAEIMNREFVNIKVDREERPDVDRVYMSFVQATTGGGGWPMSVWLTPDLKPFVGGTYFPPEARYGHPSFRSVLQRIAAAWKENHERINEQGTKIVDALKEATTAAPAAGSIDAEVVFQTAYQLFARVFDSEQGGFSRAPKFPRPAALNFLLRFWLREKTSASGQQALEMVLLTLRKMAAGGMHDHLGGGFHRYSVDAYWHVPHFEKMLYDQAQLATAYLDAFQITQEHEFENVARDILEYVRRDMNAPDGGFFSAEDADSEPVAAVYDRRERGEAAEGDAHRALLQEGAFYVWTKQEIEEALGEAAEIFTAHYGVEENGNAPAGADPAGEFTGKNILIERKSMAETATQFGRSEAEVRELLAEARAKLLAHRNHRPRPHLDDKIIAAWNGLMISVFARAARLLDDRAYLETAARAAEFLQRELWDGNTLARTFRGGRGAAGFADDYAFVIQGLLDLYEASFEVRWLEWAAELQTKMDELFWDGERGGYFATPGNDASVLLRMKEDNDSAEPAASSVAALNLTRLGAMRNQAALAERARETVAAFSVQLSRFPTALPQMLVALDFLKAAPHQIVLVGNRADPSVQALHAELRQHFLPHAVFLGLVDEQAVQYLSRDNPALRAMSARDEKRAVYVCQDFTCQAPVTEPGELRALLARSAV